MTGMERSRIALRPMRSVISSAMSVNTKFVAATHRDVKIGDVKPSREKMVAEKYMMEFCVRSKHTTIEVRKGDKQIHRVAVALAACMR